MQFSSYGREPPPHPAPTHHTQLTTKPHTTRAQLTTSATDGSTEEAAHRRNDTHQRPFPQDPTACQAGPAPTTRSIPTRRRAHPKRRTTGVLTQQTYEHRPTSRRSTLEQPPRNTRPGSGPGPTHPTRDRRASMLLRKEVIQPHLPVRLPCYDFVPIASPTFDDSLPQGVGPSASGVTDFRDVTGGVYKARERIHRSVADLRLLATPTSRGRVADPDPN